MAWLERPRRGGGHPAGDATDTVGRHPGRRGDAHFEDTHRREAALRAPGLHFVGTGISGGEEGALLGPSIMRGGSQESYASIGPMLEAICAKVDGTPCCTHVGPDGSGHFVKVVHNGIEYADAAHRRGL